MSPPRTEAQMWVLQLVDACGQIAGAGVSEICQEIWLGEDVEEREHSIVQFFTELRSGHHAVVPHGACIDFTPIRRIG